MEGWGGEKREKENKRGVIYAAPRPSSHLSSGVVVQLHAVPAAAHRQVFVQSVLDLTQRDAISQPNAMHREARRSETREQRGGCHHGGEGHSDTGRG